MIWVCRAGKSGSEYKYFIENQAIFLSWDGYDNDFSEFSSIYEVKRFVESENKEASRTAISTWTSQIMYFINDIVEGDYVIVPEKYSRSYSLAIVEGKYEYKKGERYVHRRKVRYIAQNIPRENIPMEIVYSLGAFKTIFKPRYQEQILGWLIDQK